MERLFNLDFQLLHDSVLTLISVFVLMIVASYLFFNPARDFLKKRQDRIKNDIDSAKSDKEEAAALKAEYEEKLSAIDAEKVKILDDARKKGMENQDRIVEEARAEAERIIAHARSEAELEYKSAEDEMKQQMIEIATAMAGKVVSANIDGKIQSDLVNETIKEMGDSTWLS